MEANAAMRTIVRRVNSETYREMLTRMAKESGIVPPRRMTSSGLIASGRARNCRTRTGRVRSILRKGGLDEEWLDTAGLQAGARG